MSRLNKMPDIAVNIASSNGPTVFAGSPKFSPMKASQSCTAADKKQSNNMRSADPLPATISTAIASGTLRATQYIAN
jgi:hypothetical protein